MSQAINFIADAVARLYGLLEDVVFDIGGTSVNYASIVFAFLVVFMVVTVFWKGGKA